MFAAIFSELHNVIADLEAEGHQVAGRLRDVADHIKADVEHLLGGGSDDLNALATELVKVIAPELKAAADESLRALLKTALEAVKPLVATAEGDAKQLLAQIVEALAGLVAHA